MVVGGYPRGAGVGDGGVFLVVVVWGVAMRADDAHGFKIGCAVRVFVPVYNVTRNDVERAAVRARNIKKVAVGGIVGGVDAGGSLTCQGFHLWLWD